VPRNRQEVQSVSDFMPARASPSGFAVPTCGSLSDIVQEGVFMWCILHIRHLKG